VRVSGFVLFPLFLAVVAGCAANFARLQVDYNWTSANRCSFFSQEIKVSGIPPGTRQLNVTLTDLNFPSFNHGGGTVKYEGSNLIRASALQYFYGPCPPTCCNTYSIKVNAIDEFGSIVGSGEMI